MEITKNDARTAAACELLRNIDDWVDFLVENRHETAFEATLGFWELSMNFPDFPWVPGVSVHADPWELDRAMGDDAIHELLLGKAKEALKKAETRRLRRVASGPLTPIDWLTYADGEPGSEPEE